MSTTSFINTENKIISSQKSTNNLSDLQKYKLLKEIEKKKQSSCNFIKIKNFPLNIGCIDEKCDDIKSEKNNYWSDSKNNDKPAPEKQNVSMPKPKEASNLKNISFYDLICDAIAVKLDSPEKPNTISNVELPEKCHMQNFENLNFKENDLPKNNIDKCSPFIKTSNITEEKVKGPILGLKVFACGMCKGGKLPIPKDNFFIDKGNFGDDAGFHAENLVGDALGKLRITLH